VDISHFTQLEKLFCQTFFLKRIHLHRRIHSTSAATTVAVTTGAGTVPKAR
jgi:hypothetical protein